MTPGGAGRGRRWAPTLAALGILAALGFACARHPARPRSPEIAFWEPWPPAALAPLVARFEAENPGLRVRIRQVPLEAVDDSVSAALAAGLPPDLCALGPAGMPRWLASGSLSDWSAGVADLRDSLRGWPMCTVGDALYGLPWLLRTRALVFDPGLFRRAGLDPARPPATWGELRADAARIQKLGHGVHGVGLACGDSLESALGFLSFAWGNGGEVLSAGLDSCRFDSPEVLEALEFYLSLRRSALLAPADSLAREFAAGRLGMLVGDGARLAARPAPAGPAGVALVPAPAEDRGSHAAFADGVVLVSFTSSRRKEAALRLARALVRSDRAPALAASLGGPQPANVGADSSAALAAVPVVLVLTRQCATARFAPAVARWDSMRTAIAHELAEAMGDRKSAADALSDAAARIAALVGHP